MNRAGWLVRHPDVSGLRVERVWDGAVALLRDVGLRVTNGKLLSAAQRSLIVHNDRVHFPPGVVEAFAGRLRDIGGDAEAVQRPIEVYTSGVHFRYLDAATGEARPYTLDSLLEHARFIYQLAAEGL